ncbi:MAG: FAD-binding oxidoreductase, partial [Alphaproteobacteria bacterium]|nr:FAD-binding oxidoreductase [Alphaproteobacteria bacterium]
MPESHINSYYSQTCEHKSYAPLSQDLDVDVCVIGGGLAGLNTALELACAGSKVALIEANKIAWGASGRNGGFVSAGYTLGTDILSKKLGLAKVKYMHGLTKNAVDTVRTRAKSARYNCMVTEGNIEGHLWLQETAPEELAEYNDCFGAELSYWDSLKTQGHYHTKAYKGATFDPNAFHFHPLNYALEIAALAEEKGVKIFEDTPALKISEKTGQVCVETLNGIIKANQIVLTCSGYIRNLYPKLSRATMPITTYVMVTEPLGERLAKTVTDMPYSVIDERISCDYWRPLPDGSTRILWGGRITAWPAAPDKVASIMRKSMLRIFPHLADVQIQSAWSGKMGYARHRMPMIGKINDQIWYNTGFGGHGMAATTMGAKVVAGGMTGASEDYLLFKPFG